MKRTLISAAVASVYGRVGRPLALFWPFVTTELGRERLAAAMPWTLTLLRARQRGVRR